MRTYVLGILLSLLFVSTGFAAPASAAGNTKPIRWDVYKTLYGSHGEDIPLRYGQHDDGPLDGFGTRHIEDKQELWGNWPQTANMIEKVLQTG